MHIHDTHACVVQDRKTQTRQHYGYLKQSRTQLTPQRGCLDESGADRYEEFENIEANSNTGAAGWKQAAYNVVWPTH